MINEDIAQEILGQLFSSLEALETQSAAVLQFLKDKGIASDQELAVHFEQAGKASSVRWRAARVRIDHLLSSAIKAAEEAPRPEQAKSSEDKQKPAVKGTRKTSHGKDEEASFGGGPEKETHATEKAAASGKSGTQQEPQVAASASRNQESDKTNKDPEHAANSDRKANVPSGKVA